MRIPRVEIYEKFNGHCAYCGASIAIKDMQVDHIIPRSRWHIDGRDVGYGLHDIQNLNPSCRFCNNWKHEFRIEEFRGELQAQVERARKYSANFRMAERFGLVGVNLRPVTFFFELTPAKSNKE